MPNEIIEVSTGQLAVRAAPARLRCSALGSCVAVALCDAGNRIGGLAHIMLPSTDYYLLGDDPLKYADYAIDELMRKIIRYLQPTINYQLQAVLVGGGRLDPDVLDVGRQNITAVKEKLAQEQVSVVGERIGGIISRSVMYDVESGSVWCSEDGAIAELIQG